MANMAYEEVFAMTRAQTRHRLVLTYQATGSISETACRWRTSRHVVRKWLLRYEQEGERRLEDRSHRPHSCPRQVPTEVEEQVI